MNTKYLKTVKTIITESITINGVINFIYENDILKKVNYVNIEGNDSIINEQDLFQIIGGLEHINLNFDKLRLEADLSEMDQVKGSGNSGGIGDI